MRWGIPTYGRENGFDCATTPKRTCKMRVRFPSTSTIYGYRLIDKSLVYETRE